MADSAGKKKVGFLITEDGDAWGGEDGFGQFFINRFSSIDESFDYKVFHCVSGVVPDLSEIPSYIGFVISGSHHSVNENFEWIEKCRVFIRQLAAYNENTLNTPARLYGICYGHQLIATAFGGTVKPITNKEFVFGAELVKFAPSFAGQQWFKNIFEGHQDILVAQSHGEEVSIAPDNALNVGHSSTCKNEMLAYGDHILSSQGHPEMDPDTLENIIGNRLLNTKRVTKDARDQGMERARAMPADLLTRMILDFLKH